MDQLDKQILMVLQEQARISMTELGKAVALSQPAVTERVRRMEEKGIIDHYRAIVSPKQVHKPISAFLLFHTKKCESFVAYCRDSSDVIELHRISGQYNFLVKMVAPSLQSLEDGINAMGGYGDSTTLVVLSSPIPHKHIAPL
ncbi:Lrp/AsnC family transcriptional regulator [Kroppenstedtia pulmonis]|uniref:Lrp/AsnC family transcriptional regulator n=1 Tax=Kroppenstedtia pulmonis TaxID=1380685 RepID=A0A7D3XKE5_9BACL|nr:Lrp/AsnC family transcriptional regulator [Kroppenstedtia pulmonis]QKG85559.1 Lrp/AsnC family transcriptional regulator [Kroppenstedtia pulmonis]